MTVLRMVGAGTSHNYTWPANTESELYDHWIEYAVRLEDGEHSALIGFGNRAVYGAARARVVVWIDGYPQVEFFGADDFVQSGDLLTEIKLRSDRGEPICRYPSDPVPSRYAGFTVAGMKTRVAGPGVHGAWAVIANVADHRTLCALAALRRIERSR